MGHSLDLGPLGAAQSRNVAKARQLVASTSGRVQRALEACVDLARLRLGALDGKKCWGLRAKSTCLGLDGGLLDATLASAVAALATLRLPRLEQIDGLSPAELRAAQAKLAASASSDAMACGDDDDGGDNGGGGEGVPRRVVFRRVPSCVSLGLFKGHVLVDPTREEEVLASAHVAAVLSRALPDSEPEEAGAEGAEGEHEFLLVEATADGARAPRMGSDLMHKCLAIAARRAATRGRQLEALVAAAAHGSSSDSEESDEEDDMES